MCVSLQILIEKWRESHGKMVLEENELDVRKLQSQLIK